MTRATQSVGLPLLLKALLPSASVALCTRSGLCMVLMWLLALQLRSGASTITSAMAVSACFSASRPGAKTPSSLVTSIVAMNSLLFVTYVNAYFVALGPVAGGIVADHLDHVSLEIDAAIGDDCLEAVGEGGHRARLHLRIVGL